MRRATGAYALAKSSALQVGQQCLDRNLDVIGSRVTYQRPILWVANIILFACLLIASYCDAIAAPFVESQMIHDGVKLDGGFDTRPRTVELTSQGKPSGISEQVKLDSPRQLDAIEIIEMRTNQCAGHENECAASKRISQINNADIVEQTDPLFLLAFNFFGGVLTSLLFGFVMHAKKYGINNAWRDLVFDWPIPHWMRFVPKHERDL